VSRTSHTSRHLPAPAGPYSHVVSAAGVVWTAGFGPQDPQTGAVPEGIGAQTEQVITNVEEALRVHRLGLEDVVKATVHLQHLKRDFATFNEVYARRFPEPFPVRTTVGSDLMDILVEIDVVAVPPAPLPNTSSS
jgi:2-iminobutanoate/2-iminopropanoate deaminase